MNVAIIPAGGLGSRFGTKKAKQFLELDGVPIIIRTIQHIVNCPNINELIISVPKTALDSFEELLNKYQLHKPCQIVIGGQTRQESVYAALTHIHNNTKYVVIHDSVRPFISPELISNILHAAQEHKAATVGYPITDTIKEVNNGFAISTPPREKLYAIQTPQAFEAKLLNEAHEKAISEGWTATDDAALVEKMDIPVRIILGPPNNIKITYPSDLILGEFLISITNVSSIHNTSDSTVSRNNLRIKRK